MGSESTKVYSLQAHTIVFALFPVNQGAAEDGILKVTEADDAFKAKVGADGTVVRSQTGNQLFKATLKLLYTSAINAELSALHVADRLSTNGTGVGPFLLKDNNGSTVFEATSAWITKWPDFEIGKEVGMLEWPIDCVGQLFLGGS